MRREPANGGVTLRPAMLLRYLRASFPFWFGLVWATVGLVPTVLALWQFGEVSRDRRDYYEREATITDTNSRRWDSGRSYYVDVGYLDREGNPLQTSIRVGRDEWEQARPGQTRTIHVSGADPRNAWFEHQTPSFVVPVILGFLSVVFFPTGLITMAVGARNAARRAHALRHGQPVTGHIREVRENHRVKVNRQYYWNVSWTWTGMDGREREATSPAVPYATARRFDEGQEVQVWVHPADPSVGEVDVFGVRGG